MSLRSALSARTSWLFVAAVVLLAWPVQLGGSLGLVVVAGHSMDGTYRNGDLLLTWKHDGYRRGDVIVYRVPDDEPGSGLRVVHRTIDGDNRAGFVTQGDNRDTPDIWRPKPDHIDGRPFMTLPLGGVVLRLLLSPFALALLCAVCIYLLVIGRSEDEPDRPAPHDEDREADDEIVDIPTYARPRADEPSPTS